MLKFNFSTVRSKYESGHCAASVFQAWQLLMGMMDHLAFYSQLFYELANENAL